MAVATLDDRRRPAHTFAREQGALETELAGPPAVQALVSPPLHANSSSPALDEPAMPSALVSPSSSSP